MNGKRQYPAVSTAAETPLLDNANGAAKCDGGYHVRTDYGPPASCVPRPRNAQKIAAADSEGINFPFAGDV